MLQVTKSGRRGVESEVKSQRRRLRVRKNKREGGRIIEREGKVKIMTKNNENHLLINEN
jgi:predicted RNA-binding protein YlqC (UPF0109 family)